MWCGETLPPYEVMLPLHQLGFAFLLITCVVAIGEWRSGGFQIAKFRYLFFNKCRIQVSSAAVRVAVQHSAVHCSHELLQHNTIMPWLTRWV